MSINTAHANNGVLIHAGESIIMFSENVNIDFAGKDEKEFKGTKKGKLYLTTHRLIFNNKHASDPLQSMSLPFICLSDVDIEQPVFGSNFIKGKLRSQENGNFTGEIKFKIFFPAGGAIDFASSALKAAYIAKKYAHNAAPPPYSPPSGNWYEAPPPAYASNPNGYYGWVPSTEHFSGGPPPGSVFMSDNPPPYPGIISGAGQAGYSNGYGGANANYNNGPPPYTAAGQQPGYPSPPGYPNSGYPMSPMSSPPQYPGMAPGGYPNGGQGAQASNGAGGYPQWGNPGYNGAPGFPQTTSGHVTGGGSGYPNSNPTPGFSAPSAPNSKESEAAQSAYYVQTEPHTAFVPPASYYEQPPSYNSVSNKKQD